MVEIKKEKRITSPFYRMDHKCEDRKKKSWLVKRRHWCHYKGLDSLYQTILLITPKRRTVQPRDAFEDTALKPEFEIANSEPGCRVSTLYFSVK
jgi:hypothetical protein